MPALESTLGLYVVATLLICLSPGPNVMLMISLGLRDGRAAVLAGVAGVICGSLLFLVVSALGVAAAFHASTTLFAVVRYAGAAYLLWLGVRLVLGAMRGASAEGARPAVAGDLAAGAPDASPGAMPSARLATARAFHGRAWIQGFVTQVSNPKSILFWTALLPQFLAADRPVAGQIVRLGALGIAIDAVVLAGYGLSAAAARHVAPTRELARWIDFAAGVFFVVTGALLALAHRE